MKIVVDTNRIIAALVRDSTTRAILFDDNFKFVTPDFTVTEIIEHANELKPKTKLIVKNINSGTFYYVLSI